MPEPPDAGLVCDASVLINLLATNRLEVILRSLAVPVYVTEQVYGEVYVDPRDRRRSPDLLRPFVDSGALLRVALEEAALDTFLDLTGADPPDDLDDGEAASIAFAVHHGHAAALDETKARAVCGRRFKQLRVRTTVELFQLDAVRAALDPTGFDEAVFQALRLARMRVPPEHDPWVRELLGPERIGQCPSLRRRA